LFRNICLFRTLKLRINELNDLFTTLQQDLRTRSQACELIRTVLDGCMGRILELKHEMISMDYSEYHYFDDILADLKLTPV